MLCFTEIVQNATNIATLQTLGRLASGPLLKGLFMLLFRALVSIAGLLTLKRIQSFVAPRSILCFY